VPGCASLWTNSHWARNASSDSSLTLYQLSVLFWEHWRGAMEEGLSAPNITEAVAMLQAFSSVGAASFDVTLTDIEGKKADNGYQPGRTAGELCRCIGARLESATRRRFNFIIRPRATAAALVQLDDLDRERARRIAPHGLLVLQTSPGNFQVWVAVNDPPAGFALRLKRGIGADPTASGATRIAGSLNFKTKYQPDFPRVEIAHMNPGNATTAGALDRAGFVAPPPQQPRASVPRMPVSQRWPDYQQTLRGAPLNRDGTGPDRSLADFMWCKWAAERGHPIGDIAARLTQVSEKTQERVRRGDEGYPLLTARKAAATVGGL
jgi:RepB DNA-primase from phage plasmid